MSFPYEELQRRLAEQQIELDSLNGQRRDRDATIEFLKRKVVSLKGGARDDGGDLQALVEQREQRIRELEDHLEQAREEIQLCQRGDEAAQALRRQLQQGGREVESLRAALDRCQGEMQLCRRQDAHEIAELQRRLQVRDEQMHAMGAAMEDMENEYHEGCSQEDFRRVAEQNRCLAEKLQRAKRRGEDLSLQLQDRELEAGALARQVRGLQKELEKIRQDLVREDQDAGLHGNDGMGLPASAVRSPKASLCATEPSSRAPSFSSDLASHPDVCRVAEIALNQGHQDREDTVLQLCREVLRMQSQIHGQIAEQGSSLARDEQPLPLQRRSFGQEAWPREGCSSSAASRPEVQEAASPEADCGAESPPAAPVTRAERAPKGPTTPKAAAGSPQSLKKAGSAARLGARRAAAAPKAASVVPAAAEEAAELEGPACEGAAAGGGPPVSLSFFDKEDLKAKQAKQQRVVRRIEERRRFEKAKSDDAMAAAVEAAPEPRRQERPLLQSAGRSKVMSSKTLRRGLSLETDAWDSWPIATPGVRRCTSDLTCSHENSQHSTEESGVPSLHDRFASIRAEMKMRRCSHPGGKCMDAPTLRGH